MPGNTTEFGGRDIKIRWRVSSNNVPDPLEETFSVSEVEPDSKGFGNAADAGAQDPHFRDYRVDVQDPATGDLLRTVHTIDSFFKYRYEENVEDGGPRRRVRFVVRARNVLGVLSDPSEIVVENPPPASIDDAICTGEVNRIRIDYSLPNDLDVEGILVWRDTSPGFTPSPSNLQYDGFASPIYLSGDPNGTYYLRIAAYDAFDKTTLNVSDEFSVALPPIGFEPTSSGLVLAPDGEEFFLHNDKRLKMTAPKIVLEGPTITLQSLTSSGTGITNIVTDAMTVNANSGVGVYAEDFSLNAAETGYLIADRLDLRAEELIALRAYGSANIAATSQGGELTASGMRGGMILPVLSASDISNHLNHTKGGIYYDLPADAVKIFVGGQWQTVSTGTGGLDTSSNQTISGDWEFSNSLTVSGEAVSVAGIPTLQDVYERGEALDIGLSTPITLDSVFSGQAGFKTTSTRISPFVRMASNNGTTTKLVTMASAGTNALGVDLNVSVNGQVDVLDSLGNYLRLQITPLFGLAGISTNMALLVLTATKFLVRGAVEFNDQNSDYDVQINGTSDNVVYVDAGNNRIGVLTNAPTADLSVSGTGAFDEGLTVSGTPVALSPYRVYAEQPSDQTISSSEANLTGLTGIPIPGADGSRKYRVSVFLPFSDASGSGNQVVGAYIYVGTNGGTSDSTFVQRAVSFVEDAAGYDDHISLSGFQIVPAAGEKIGVSMATSGNNVTLFGSPGSTKGVAYLEVEEIVQRN